MRRQVGFTLIEVLIAATILFTALVVASASYRTALLASSRAETVVSMLTPLPLITSAIRNQLRSSPVDSQRGEAELLGVAYAWQATTSRYGSPPARFDPDEIEFREYRPRFRLYDIELTLRLRGQERRYLYQEVAWEPMRR